jgi:cell division protein FtsQ
MNRRHEREINDFLPFTPSPILGPQRKVEAEKRSRNLAEALLWTLKFSFGLMFLTCIGVGYYLIWQVLLHDPRFELAVKEVRGLHHVSENQILMKVKDFEKPEISLYALNLESMRKSIEQIPWIKEATLRRNFPDRLVIEVEERVPIAYVRFDRATLLMDDHGVFLDATLGESASLDLPVIQGMEDGMDEPILERNRTRLKAYQQLLQELDANGAGLSKDLSEVYLAKPEDLGVILNDETVLVKLGSSTLQEKFRRYLAIGRELRQKYPGLDTVDLRFQNQVLISVAGTSQVLEQPQ